MKKKEKEINNISTVNNGVTPSQDCEAQRSGRYAGLKEWCKEKNIDYTSVFQLLNHKQCQTREEAYKMLTSKLDPGINVDDDLNKLDMDGLRMVKLQKEIIHKKLESEKVKTQVQKIRGDLVPFSELTEMIAIIATTTRTEVGSLVNKLPGKLEGQSSDKCIVILRDEIDACLQNLSTAIGDQIEQLRAKVGNE